MTSTLRLQNGDIISMNRETSNRIGYGNTEGWFDPWGSRFRPFDLIGSPSTPGIYWRMRYRHPLIKSILDQRKNLIASTPIHWSGPHADKLNAFWDSLSAKNVNLKLSRLLSHIIDEKASFGFCLLEKAWNINDLQLWHVDPITVFEFESDDPTALEPSGIRFQYTDNLTTQTLPFSRFYLFSDSVYPGNWWGDAEMGSLLVDYIAYEAEYKLYLGQRLLEKGVVHAKETSASSKVSWEEMRGNLLSLLRGQDIAVMTDSAWDLSVLQISNGQDSVQQRVDANIHFGDLIRQTLNSNLNTLGLSSTGSRALGETIKVADGEKFEAYLERQFEDFISSDLVIDLAAMLDIPHNEISIGTVGVQYSSDRIDTAMLWGLIEKNVLPINAMGKGNFEFLLKASGLDPKGVQWPIAPPVDITASIKPDENKPTEDVLNKASEIQREG